MLARKLISRNACRRPGRFEKVRLTSFSIGLPRTVCSFEKDFIALEMKESLLTFHDDNFCKFHVLHACKGNARALKTRGRFVTKCGKKSRNLNPGLTAWVTALSKGLLLTLIVKSLFIWDNLNWLPISMYLVFLRFKVNLFADSHDWIKFIS